MDVRLRDCPSQRRLVCIKVSSAPTSRRMYVGGVVVVSHVYSGFITDVDLLKALDEVSLR